MSGIIGLCRGEHGGAIILVDLIDQRVGVDPVERHRRGKDLLGDGEVDLHHAIAALKNAGYEGVFCAEYEGKETEGGVGYKKCFEWMQQNL